MNRIKINNKIQGKRERLYVYLDKETLIWLKQEAKDLGISVSKYVTTLIKQQEEQDIKLRLKFDE